MKKHGIRIFKYEEVDYINLGVTGVFYFEFENGYETSVLETKIDGEYSVSISKELEELLPNLKNKVEKMYSFLLVNMAVEDVNKLLDKINALSKK